MRELRLFDPPVATYIRNEFAFPHVRHAFQITRTVTKLSTSKTSVETVYGLASHPLISAAELNTAVRNHWSIEALHHVRDVSFGEDRSTVRTGSGPQMMAALRNLTIGLFGMIRRRLSRKIDAPVLLRHFARSQEGVFRILGL